MVRKLELTFVIYPVQRITVSGLAVRSDKCPSSYFRFADLV